MYCEVKGLALFDSDGVKIYSRYYNCASLTTQSAISLFEHQLYTKTTKVGAKNLEGEALLIDQFTVVFKMMNDVILYVIADNEENEILMATLLDALAEALEVLYRGEIEVNKIATELDLLMLAFDETVDNGIIITIEASTIAENTLMRSGVVVAEKPSAKAETGFKKALNSAKEALKKTLMN